jgi:hypothetical protein
MAAMPSEATRPTSPDQARAALPSRPGHFLPACAIADCGREACGWVDTVQHPTIPSDHDGRGWLCDAHWRIHVNHEPDPGQLRLFP